MAGAFSNGEMNMFNNDWETENLTIFNTKSNVPSSASIDLTNRQDDVTEPAPLDQQLHALVLENNICEAEDLLFEMSGQLPREQYMEVASQFYQELLWLSDEQLECANFSRQEILDGLEAIQHLHESLPEAD
jgi:hypothetical protein